MKTKREKANYLIQSVSHSIDVLEELAKANGEIGVTELAKRLKLHKNNVFRLLATLELRGLAIQNPQTENYALGVTCLELGQAYVSNSRLITRIYPILNELSNETSETVSFATLNDLNISYPISIEAKRAVKVGVRTGVSVKAVKSAAGKLLLAQIPQELLVENFTDKISANDLATVSNESPALRQSGTITDKGTFEPDVITIAKTISGFNGDCIGAVEISAPQYRAKLEQLMPKLEATCKKITEVISGVKKTLAADVETTKDQSATYASNIKEMKSSLLNPKGA